MKKRAWWLFRVLGLQKNRLLAGAVCYGVFSASETIASALLLHVAFDSIVNGDLHSLLSGVIVLAGVLVLVLAGQAVSQRAFQSAAAEVTGEIRKSLFTHFVHLPCAKLDAIHSGDLVFRLNSDITACEQLYAEIPLDVTAHLFSGVAGLLYLGSIDWRLSLYAASVGLASLINNVLLARTLRSLSRRSQEKSAVLTQRFSDALAGCTEMRAFGLFTTLENQFVVAADEAYSAGIQRVHRRALVSVATDFLFFSAQIGLVLVGCFMAIKGHLSLGAVMGTLAVIGPVVRLFYSLSSAAANAQSALGASDRIGDLLDWCPEPVQRADNKPVEDCREYVEVDHVSFSYTGTSLALDDVSFAVKRDQTVALVGPSGSGKSTVFKLLLGLYDTQKGSLTVCGHPLSQTPTSVIRRLVAVVTQPPVLFTGTVAENIRYGRIDATPEEVVAAARAANAHDFIVAREGGYEMDVGEGGGRLSGGERQRIAIARAILRNAPLLLLDEATSALDSENETLVQQAMDRLRSGRTTIVIAHRLSTVRLADKIIVLDNGRVVETGTHDELVGRGELYRTLYDLSVK